MSGVFNRMVQRSRGELPTIEPLMTSQRTALSVQPALTVETSEREANSHEANSHEANSRSAPLRQRSPVKQQPRPSWAIGSRNENQEQSDVQSSDATKVARTPQSAPRRQNDSDESIKSAPPHLTMEQSIAAEHTSQTSAVPSGHARTEEPQTQDERITSADFAAPLGQALELRGRKDSELRPGPPREPRNPAATAHPAARAADQGIETAIEHTDIHITIGNVELRAPRVEARAPAFRPRVTLHDYLNRRPGAES